MQDTNRDCRARYEALPVPSALSPPPPGAMLFDLAILVAIGWLLYVSGCLLYRLVQTLMKLAGVVLGTAFLIIATSLLFPDRMQSWEARLQETPLERFTTLADEAGQSLADRLRRLDQ